MLQYKICENYGKIAISDPDLNRNATNYKYNHTYGATQIEIKYLNMLTNRNRNKLARVMVAYL